ncbi:MAG: TlpA family protein disulfide reductase [Candidatus Omnitrophica bacterium]|nr:TlpA family protein disulfide reductase [Candidatus Omnitrophota bacterium]
MTAWQKGLVFVSVVFLIVGCGQKPSTANNNPAPLLSPKDLGPVPNFSLPTPEGTLFSSSELQGKVALIDFWATWCPPCQEEVPGFVDLYNRYQDKGLVIVGISVDEGGVEQVKEFMKEYSVNYPIVMADDEVIRAFGGIRGLPTTFLVDAQGRIVKRYVGFHSMKEFEKDISNFLLTSS